MTETEKSPACLCADDALLPDLPEFYSWGSVGPYMAMVLSVEPGIKISAVYIDSDQDLMFWRTAYWPAALIEIFLREHRERDWASLRVTEYSELDV